MSRRDAGAAASPGARHAGSRLQASLGSGSGGLLPGGAEAFLYGGSSGPGRASEPDDGARAETSSGWMAGTLPTAGQAGPVLRWRLGLRAALFVGIVAVLCGAWFWWQVSAGRPEVLPLSDVTPSGSAASASPAADSTEAAAAGDEGPGGAAPEVLHVAGAVARPGIVELAPGSRVHDALAAAGGSIPTADVDRLNLAAVVVDGQKIYVPRQGEPLPADDAGAAPGTAGGAASPSTAGKVSLNSAGLDELGTLPRVGPVLAQRIVDWRKEHGPFTSVEELDAVEGVGPKMLEALLPLVSVD